MKNLYLTISILVLGLFSVSAQPTVNISNTTGDPGGSVSVDFSVDDFTNVVGMQFSINWDPTVLQFNSLTNISTAIRDFDSGAFNTDSKFTDDGIIILTWFDNSAEPNTVPNGTIIFTVNFDIVGGPGSSTIVDITDDPRKIEVIDNNENNVGLTASGGLFTASGGGGGGNLRLVGSDEMGETGSTVCVDISVDGFTDIAGMQFSLNWDPAFLEFQGVGQFNLSGLNDGSFNIADVGDGKLRLQWLDPASAGVTLAAGTNIFQICFEILGTTGTRSVQFSNDPLPIEIVDADDMRVNFTKKDGTVTVSGTGGGGSDCNAEGFAVAATDTGADPGSEVCIDISVKEFNQILSLAGSIEWDPNVISNPSVGAFNLDGLSEGNFNLDQGANGMLSFVWFDPSTDGITLADGATIFEICFDVIGENGQSTAIEFTDALTEREVSDVNEVLPFNQCDGAVNVGGGGGIQKTTSNPSCPGEEDGSINISINTGTPPYTVTWSTGGNVISTDEDLIGVGAGTYMLRITDGAGMELTNEEITLSDPPGVRITDISVADATTGNTDGSVDITTAGGSNVTYSWSTGATSQDLDNVGAGSYGLTITDGNGCTIDTTIAVGGGGFMASLDVTDFNGFGNSCMGECDGVASVVVSGGTSPYSFTWDNGETSATRSGLCAGEITVTVSDDAGNQSILTRQINEPEMLELSIEGSPSPNDIEGTAEATVTGGAEPYTYRWSNGATTRFIINLAQGVYTLVVTDANGCQVTDQVLITNVDAECFTGRLVITPNSDSRNDELFIACAEGTDNELQIFNR
ncbi:MAG: cohesin domain-containing protein, partial [Saprospiraceae bacterium]|nr:cohesin domain-containing protein [Saprospiraceae bacterium]